MSASWVLELPVQILVELLDLDDVVRDLVQPVVLIFSTEDNEFSVSGFATKVEAKEYMEHEQADFEGYLLEHAFVEGKPVEWKEKRNFDFVEKKCSPR